MRALPSIDALLRRDDAAGLIAAHGRIATRDALRAAVQGARGDGASADAGELVATAAAALEATHGARRVINATGVVIHTNLGRAPLAAAALERIVAVAGGYSSLEFDLRSGRRGSRREYAGALIAELTGAEAGLAVNNNAAALLLSLAALAGRGEVLISRGELIEIGDGYRIPDVLAQSGARLVELGTTNRTSADDYARAIGPETTAILRVHQSNFRIVGFTHRPSLAELCALASEHDLPLIDDLGSGQLIDFGTMDDEPTARSSIEAGATLVCFSGDKLLGGPQAGVIAGRREAVETAARHPLARAVRIDKLSLAALEATFELYRDPQRAVREIPVLRAIAEPIEAVRDRAERLAAQLGGEVVASEAAVGGGAAPLLVLPSFACALDGGAETAARLRAGDPPVIARVHEGCVLLDCRTIRDDELCQIPS